MKKSRKQNLVVRVGAFAWLVAAVLLCTASAGFAASGGELDQRIQDRETAFYREFFDRIFYEPIASLLRFDQIADRLLFRKQGALDVNIYDEVPDSSFFVNRHGRKRLSSSELRQGPSTGNGPDPSGSWTVYKGKVEGVSAGFFIQDQKGDRYLLKFDPKDHPEMTTSAEIISHKFFYALGYHVPEYYLVHFNPEILRVDPKATYYDENGFKQPLTQEALGGLLERIPKFKGGILRASASKIIPHGKGYMDFESRRKADPDDLIPHEDRRSIRSLRVFGSWLNHYDLREGNTLDVMTADDGKTYVKHYLLDFGSTLGSAASHPKVPAAGYEHIVDWYAVGKATPTLKVVEKPWEEKWDTLQRKIAYPALGYFDNFNFDPKKWKTQLPYPVFDRLTPSDAFWAAKTLMSFTDEDIRTVVESADFSDPEDAKILSEILITRRDIIARYWFSHLAPLDQIRLFETQEGMYEIRFTDLAVRYGFEKSEEAHYRYQWVTKNQQGERHEGPLQEFTGESFPFDIASIGQGEGITFLVQAKYRSDSEWSTPPLQIVLTKANQDSSLAVSEISHGV